MFKFIIVFLSLKAEIIFALRWNESYENFPKSWRIDKIDNIELLSIINDPLDPNIRVLKIKHPKGSCSSYCGTPGGAGFKVKPFGNLSIDIASFQYEVFFHSEFDFVKSGKLPGLFGGSNDCSGCNSDIKSRENCFSTRIVWKSKGFGNPYLYLPLGVKQEDDFCKNTIRGTCEVGCGLGFDSKKYFKTGKWNSVKVKIILNTPGKNNGILNVWINGEKMTSYNKMNFRTKKSVGISGFIVHPFFGGSGLSFATKVNTYTLYKNFKLTDF